MLTYLLNLLPPVMVLGIQYLALIIVISFLFGFFYAFGHDTYWTIYNKLEEIWNKQNNQN